MLRPPLNLPHSSNTNMAHLSVTANKELFSLPDTAAGDILARLPLKWGVVAGHIQPCIDDDRIIYPDYQHAPASAAAFYDPYPFKSNKNKQ